MKNRIESIRDLRMKNEKGKVVCAREINENIKRVFKNKPLTRPLRVLNKSCAFKKRYKMAFDIINRDKIKKEVKLKSKEYRQRPEVKKRMKEYYLKNKNGRI